MAVLDLSRVVSMAEAEALEALSKLPEPLIHHILSFLTTEEAAKTSLLSKSWLNAWRTRPTLELNYAQFFSKKQFCHVGLEFISYIERALQRYGEQNVVVDTFKLNFGPYIDDKSLIVEKCTKLAIKYGVRSLDLVIRKWGELPRIVLETESLVRLHITGCNLKQQSSVEEEIRCHRLKRLALFNVCLEDIMLQKVISSCPLIEFLEISECYALDNIIIDKVHNLKRFIVRLVRDQRVEIVDAPNLELINCYNAEDDLGDEEQIPCWLTLHRPQYQNLKNLVVSGVVINEIFFINLANKFPHLEDLKIHHCQNLKIIKISSHSLKKIHLRNNWDLMEAQFDVPSIVRFEYESCNFIQDLYFRAASGHWISDICINNSMDVDTSWFLGLKGFLANLTQSEISLEFTFKGCTFDINEIRNPEVLVTPLEVQHLSIYGYYNSTEYPAETIINGIFWICHPKTILVEYIREKQFMKSLCEMMIRKNDDQFTDLQQNKFWQQNLKGVKFVEGEIKLEWKTPYMAREAKGLKRRHSELA